MNIKQIATDFNVSIFSQDIDLGVDIKLNLKSNNYQVDLFSDHDEMFDHLEKSPSHIVVVDVSTLIISVDQLFERLLKISNEVKIVILAPAENVLSFNQYADYNLSAVLSSSDTFLTRYICQACDLITESLYRLYQNEHLLSLYENENKKHQQLDSILKSERTSTQVRPYQIRISEYKSCRSKEELLDIFYQQAQLQSWVYLKYIPSIETFISVSSHQVPDSWVEGLSYKVPMNTPNFHQQLFQGVLPKSFENYLLNKFEVKQLKFIPLIIKDQIEGLMISTQDISAESAEDFSLLGLVYTNLVYESQPKYMDVEDSLTGFYNQLFYKRILDKEIDRAKRTQQPIALIKVGIDKFLEIEATLGKIATDEIIKKIAEVIKNSSRLPDYICRTADNEFSLVLVNCNRKGAVLRAERLREALNVDNYVQSGVRITVSQGISEYPTLSGTVLDLDLSAVKALNFISEKGGDKICLSKAAHGYQPDFVVDES